MREHSVLHSGETGMRRNVLITGGSSGIGTAMVREFAAAGYAVRFTYWTGKERAEALCAELSDKDALAFPLDLGERASHESLLAALTEPVDILVNNAGLGSKTVEQVSADPLEQDEALFRVNAVGALWLCRDLLPGMRARGFGKILLVSSVGGGVAVFPGFHMADGMSKAALAYLGRHLQGACNHDPIDIFTICPGATDTPMFAASTLNLLDAKARAGFVDALPGGRLIDPAEIARLAVWLCTEEARVLRGAVLDASLGLGADPGSLPRSSGNS
jgi:NAD(P)-dependent dehydrogenase (short-subunit alcohol dehydrogenase family)